MACSFVLSNFMTHRKNPFLFFHDLVIAQFLMKLTIQMVDAMRFTNVIRDYGIVYFYFHSQIAIRSFVPFAKYAKVAIQFY